MTMRIGRPLPNVTVCERVSVDPLARRWPLLEQQSRRPAAPPPTQVLQPALVEDTGRILLPKVEATYVLQPPLLLDNEDEVLARQRAFGREAGARKRHLDAQLTDEDLAEIDDIRSRKPKASAYWIAQQMQKEGSATVVTYQEKGKLVPYTVEALARKITRARPLK